MNSNPSKSLSFSPKTIRTTLGLYSSSYQFEILTDRFKTIRITLTLTCERPLPKKGRKEEAKYIMVNILRRRKE